MRDVIFVMICTLALVVSIILTRDMDDSVYAEVPVENRQYVEDDELECLALNIYHESRSDNLAGKAAVADVVMNRVLDSRYPNTICGAVYQGKRSKWWADRGEDVPVRNMCQFSWFCDGEPDEPKNEVAWKEAHLIANNFLAYGHYRGITEGATHYHATYVNPNWIYDKGMHLIGRIGDHIFYRWQ